MHAFATLPGVRARRWGLYRAESRQRFATVPAASATAGISLFMDSTMATSRPSATASPAFTMQCIWTPGTGDSFSSGSPPEIALSWPQFALAPDSLTMTLHFAISAFRKASSSAGLEPIV